LEKENKITEFRNIISTLPGKPGVYQYFDKDNRILYVGKAKNIKKRVSSYFTKTHQQGKVKVLVKKIGNEYIKTVKGVGYRFNK